MAQAGAQTNLERALRHGAVLAALIALILGLFFQGTRGIWDPDEGRYSGVALQMIDSGDYLTPRRNDDTLHVTKPPLVYWTIAASVNAFGRNEWAMRLPMAVAFALTVGMVFSLGRIFVPRRPWLPALVYLASPLPFLAANTITTDTLLACAETAAMLAYARFRFAGDGPRWLDAMWALFGVAFMVKGPPALLPLLAILPWEFRQRSGALLRPVGLLAFVVVGFSWFAWIIHAHPELLGYFLGHEVVGRIASADMDRHGQWYGGFMVYLPTLLLGALPWAAVAAWRRARGTTPDADVGQSRFLWLWFALPLLVFFLSRSRLPYYVLPLFVPLSLLLARALADLEPTRARIAMVAGWMLLLLAAKGALAHVSNEQDSRALARELRKVLPESPREIALVQTKARYGLRHYFNAEIETISLQPLPPGIRDRYDDDLRHELAEAEPGTYYLVPVAKSPAFIAQVAASGASARKLGTVRRLDVFALDRGGD